MGIVYSGLKALRFPDQVRAFMDGRVAAPLHVRIKPVNACNHRCWYCAYRADALQLGDQMREADRLSGAKLDEIVDDLVSMGVGAATFSGGGEPLLHPGLPRAVERLAQGGVRVAALTNGSRLRGAAARALAEHATWVRVSIDSWDGPSYAASRGVHAGAYDEVLGNLEDFAALGKSCALGASFIIGKANASHIAEFCRQAKDAGVGSVKLSACVVGNSALENDAYHASIADEFRGQIDAGRALEDSGFKIVDHYHLMSGRFDKQYRGCPSARFLTVIGADAHVYACQDKAYTSAGSLGSIRERSFKEFWFSKENRERLSAIDPSRDCRHHCVADAKNRLLDELSSLDPDHAPFV